MNRQSSQLALLLILLGTSAAPAQLLQSLSEDSAAEERQDPDKPIVYVVHLAPVREAKPPLKYQFLRTPRETRPGNAAIHYYRAVALVLASHKVMPEVDAWRTCPLNEFPVEDAGKKLAAWHRVFTELEAASRCSRCDWDMDTSDLNTEALISFNLTEFQTMRTLSRMLQIRFRHALLTGDEETAFRSLQMGYRLANDLGDTPWLVNSLIGIAIATVNHESALEWMEHSDGGNLYWAFAGLPHPLVGMRLAIQHESLLAERMLTLDDELSDTPGETWRRRLSSVFDTLRELDSYSRSGAFAHDNDWLALAAGLRGYSDSKRGLTAAGLDVEQWPVGKVLWQQTVRSARLTTDSIVKYTYLPHHIRRPESSYTIERWGFAGRDVADREPLPLVTMLLPALNAADRAQLRLTKRIAALQTIEGIRDFAARHGFLPQDLDALGLPQMLDPETNEPFYYEASGQRAVLREPAPRGLPAMVGRDYLLILEK